jgi:hypothetical protein
MNLLGIIAGELLVSALVARRHRSIGRDQRELMPAD